MSVASRLLATSALALVAAFGLAACQEEKVVPASEVRPVKVVAAQPTATTRALTFSGTVKARVESDIGFRVGGKITQRLVSIGDHVAAGDVVARLDAADLKLALTSTDAAVASARSRRQVAADAVGRAKALFEKGHVAKAALDQATLELDAAAGALDQALAARDQAANQIAYADLKADASGVVTRVVGEPGQVVAAGQPVVTVARDGEKEIAFAVPETDIRHLSAGGMLAVGLWADPSVNIAGKVREVAGQADPAARTFAVRAAVADDPRLRLGMTASVRVEAPVASAGIALPLAALVGNGEAKIVWVVDRATETVSPRAVGVAGITPDGVNVTSGVLPGELVVTAGTQFLVPGKKVRLPAQVTASVASETH